MLKTVLTGFLFAVLLVSGIARAETLVPPLWKDSALVLGNDDGSKFLQLLNELPKMATMLESRDPLLTRFVAQQLLACDALAERHTYEVDHDGAVLVQRVRFWMLLIIGRYGDASACARALFEKTHESGFLLWKAIADEKGGRDSEVNEDTATASPDAVLGCAHFYASLGYTEKALKLASAVWRATPANSAARLDSSLLLAGIHFALGRERSARRILYSTTIELRIPDRKAYIETIVGIVWIKERLQESAIWRSLAENSDLSNWRAKVEQYKASRDFNFASSISIALFDMSPLNSPTASEMIDNFVLWGQKDNLDSFARVTASEGERYISLIFAYLDFYDISTASMWLAENLRGSENGARLCSAFLERCHLRGCDPSTVIMTDDFPVMAKAYFALETHQFSHLETLISELRKKDPQNPVLVLAPMAASVLRGGDVNISLDVLETFLSKREIPPEWLRNFRYEEVVSKSLSVTPGTIQILEPIIRKAVDRLAGPNPKAFEIALLFSALCGNDERFALMVANDLSNAIATAAQNEIPAWYAEVLYLRLSAICDNPGAYKAVEIAAGYFNHHGGLLFLLGQVSIMQGKDSEAIRALNDAFIYGDGIIRAKAEELLKSLD